MRETDREGEIGGGEGETLNFCQYNSNQGIGVQTMYLCPVINYLPVCNFVSVQTWNKISHLAWNNV